MKKIKFTLLITLLVFLSSCDMTYDFKPGEDIYVGYWENPVAYINVSSNGKFSYKREEGGTKVSISGAIKSIGEENIIVDVLVTESTFKIDEAPYLNENGNWEMTVDGRKYLKIE